MMSMWFLLTNKRLSASFQALYTQPVLENHVLLLNDLITMTFWG